MLNKKLIYQKIMIHVMMRKKLLR